MVRAGTGMVRAADWTGGAVARAHADGLCARTIDTPIGPVILVASVAGLREVRLPAGPGSSPGALSPRAQAPLAEAHLDRAESELAEYFAGCRREFAIALDPIGTPFQQRAWAVLRTIPFATTISYSEQARAVGGRRYSRAVGSANGRNPLPIVVACHRVVASTGGLGGYSGGLGVKAWLLGHEREAAAGSPTAAGSPAAAG